MPARRLQQLVGQRIIDLGVPHQVQLDRLQLPIEVVDQCQIDLDAAARAGLGELLGYALAIGGEAELLRQRRQVVLADAVLNVGHRFAAGAHQLHPTTQEVAGRSHRLWIGVGHRHHATSQEQRYLVAVNLVVLGLATVDGLHVERMAQYEGNLLAGAEIGQPVPGEHALDADDKFLAVEADRVEKVVGPAGQIAVNERFARLADDADVHCLGMQIDPAVESMLLRVKSHHGPPWNGWRLSPPLSTRPPRSVLCEPSGIAI
jgi:hypothetical protein